MTELSNNSFLLEHAFSGPPTSQAGGGILNNEGPAAPGSRVLQLRSSKVYVPVERARGLPVGFRLTGKPEVEVFVAQMYIWCKNNSLELKFCSVGENSATLSPLLLLCSPLIWYASLPPELVLTPVH